MGSRKSEHVLQASTVNVLFTIFLINQTAPDKYIFIYLILINILIIIFHTFNISYAKMRKVNIMFHDYVYQTLYERVTVVKTLKYTYIYIYI